MAEPTNQKERTRARILDEAAKAMREHGSEGVGVATLMKRAGLTHGGFYAHFDNRDDLVAHAIDRMFQDSRLMLDHHLGRREAAAGLRSLIDYYLSEGSRRHPERGCPLPRLSGEGDRLPAAARDRFDAGIAGFIASLERVLTALGAPDPAALASSVLAELVGAVALARAAASEERAHAILAASRDQLGRRLGV